MINAMENAPAVLERLTLQIEETLKEPARTDIYDALTEDHEFFGLSGLMEKGNLPEQYINGEYYTLLDTLTQLRYLAQRVFALASGDKKNDAKRLYEEEFKIVAGAFIKIFEYWRLGLQTPAATNSLPKCFREIIREI